MTAAQWGSVSSVRLSSRYSSLTCWSSSAPLVPRWVSVQSPSCVIMFIFLCLVYIKTLTDSEFRKSRILMFLAVWCHQELPRFQELIFEDFSRFILVENIFEEVVLHSVMKDIMMGESSTVCLILSVSILSSDIKNFLNNGNIKNPVTSFSHSIHVKLTINLVSCSVILYIFI